MNNRPEGCHPANRWLKFFRKWHRWPGVIMGFFFVLWAISGVVMNHRKLFSPLDISRKLVPKENRYENWNNAAVKSAVPFGSDSLLVYGNIGIWLTDSGFSSWTDFNHGFPAGIDNRKVSAMLRTGQGNLYAGTLFGLFFYDAAGRAWKKIDLDLEDERIQWLAEKHGKVLVLTRSELLEAPDNPSDFDAVALPLPPPEGYDDKAGLFRTIWVIHSGEIFGTFGKLIVDLLGLIVILLAITGALHFSMPYALRYLKRRKKPLQGASATKRFSAKWHKKAGIWIALFLMINTITGMFLRPPLLITIASARVGKIPWSVLDTPNPWDDRLRALIYDEEIDGYIFGTTEGLFYADEGLSKEMILLPGQPPVSVMGINVFQKSDHGRYLVGSFNGIYDWHLHLNPARTDDWQGNSFHHFTGTPPQFTDTRSKPFGEEMISGYIQMDLGQSVYFDYNRGVIARDHPLLMRDMPLEIIEKSPMSWWNFALEVHTGRIFKPLMGDFYIFIVPLMGIFGTLLVISGFIVWIKLYGRKNR